MGSDVSFYKCFKWFNQINISRCYHRIFVRNRKFVGFVLLFIGFVFFYQFTYKMRQTKLTYVYPKDSYALPCEMPALDPFDPNQLASVRKTKPFDCGVSNNVVYVDETNILRVNQSAFPQLKEGDIHCQCKIIHRAPNSDKSVNYSDTFDCDPPFNVQGDLFKIVCWLRKMEIFDSQLTKVLRIEKKFKPDTDQYYNVILFGIDSLSTNAARRQIPNVVKYLEEETGATIFSMHNRIGEHTFDNIIPMLTGFLENNVEIPYLDEVGERFQKFPLIWRNFSEQNNYATFYGEDDAALQTFNTAHEGFSEKPTDHYLRPFWLDHQRPSRLLFWKKDRCVGNTPKYLVLMNYLRQFIHTYRNERKFSMSHINDLTHENVNNLRQAESHFIEFFKWLQNNGHLNDSFLFVFGDHGPRGQSQSHQSLLETNLPFLSIVTPSNFTRSYPQLISNLKNNAKVLTTHFDVFATLRDILNREFLQPSIFYLNGKPRGISLFRKIGVQRSCKDASIPEQFCTCFGSKPINMTGDPFIQEIGQSVVDKLNSMTSSEAKCALLSLSAILETRVRDAGLRKERGKEETSNDFSEVTNFIKYNSEYRIIVETVPGNGKFYATSKINSSGKRYVLDHIERVNRYNNQSSCISNDILRPICYCKP